MTVSVTTRAIFCLLAICLALTAHATSVRPPTFDELILDAELVFRGRVTSVESRWTGAGREERIATFVTFAIERVLKGAASTTVTLEFLGGQIGRRRLEVVGMPRFVVGERGIFFVENQAGQLCPLVRLRHGRYRLMSEENSDVERVVRDDFAPLHQIAQVGVPLAERAGVPAAGAARGALTRAEFEEQVVTRARELNAASNRARP